MTDWEYKIESLSTNWGLKEGGFDANVHAWLNHLGSEGWELIHFTILLTTVLGVFKRPRRSYA